MIVQSGAECAAAGSSPDRSAFCLIGVHEERCLVSGLQVELSLCRVSGLMAVQCSLQGVRGLS